MKKKYICPITKVITIKTESIILATSVKVNPDDLQDINDEIGNGNQLSKPYSVFDDYDGEW